jgi:hypothetical protein
VGEQNSGGASRHISETSGFRHHHRGHTHILRFTPSSTTDSGLFSTTTTPFSSNAMRSSSDTSTVCDGGSVMPAMSAWVWLGEWEVSVAVSERSQRSYSDSVFFEERRDRVVVSVVVDSLDMVIGGRGAIARVRCQAGSAVNQNEWGMETEGMKVGDGWGVVLGVVLTLATV